jgi:uroporphyrinogen III methyltransferase/synthase
VLIATVGTLATSAKKNKIQAPAVVVVGSVVGLRKKLAWWGKRPLAGKRIVLTASNHLRKGWREVFEENGAEVWEIPMTHIEALPPQRKWIDKIHQADWLVFTSAAGVRAFPAIVGDWRKIARCNIAAVGKSTADVLRSIGLEPDWVGRGSGSKELAQGWPKWAKGKILHLTGDSGTGDMAKLFQAKGFSVESLVIYRNREARAIPVPVRKGLNREGADWVVFASGTAAERFRNTIPLWRSEPKVVVIGPATVRAARKVGWKVCAVAKEPSVAGVLSAILKKS